MPKYIYRVRDEQGKVIRGSMEASAPEAVAERLEKLGYIVTSISPQKIPLSLDKILGRYFKVKTDDLIMLTLQLSNMLASGMSLPGALHVLIEQIEAVRLRQALVETYEDVRAGKTFSEALRKHPQVFSPLYVNMVEAGEVGGNLEEILSRLASFSEHEAELKQKVATAMLYPIILLVVGVVVVAFVIISVLPAFVSIFREAQISLPLPTKILFNLNLILRNYWLFILGVILFLWLLFNSYLKTPSGRTNFDAFKLKIPLWGPLLRKVSVARLSRTLAALISGGIPMLQALETTEKTIDNVVLAKVIREVIVHVSRGESMCIPLRTSGEFPPMAIQMIAVGEETGSLPTMLNKIADFYELDTDYSVKRITASLEPIFLIVIGGVVGFIFASILLPIFGMVRTLRR